MSADEALQKEKGAAKGQGLLLQTLGGREVDLTSARLRSNLSAAWGKSFRPHDEGRQPGIASGGTMAARKKPPQTHSPEEPAARFVITLGAARRSLAMATATQLDLDRLPDAEGKLRLLVSAEDMQRLLDNGHDVRVTATVPVAPLDDELVMSDRNAKHWLDEQVKGIPRKRGR